MKLQSVIIFSFLALVAFTSCKKTNNQELRDKEKELLEKYIAKFHPGVEPTESGLYFIPIEEGDTNDTIKNGNLAKVFYEGYLIEENDTTGIQDGYKFDASGDFEPFAFTVGAGQVISGWDEAIKLMHDEGKAKIILPSKLAYGSTGSGYIPRYAPLVFYIDIYKIYREDDEVPEISRQRMRDLIR